MPRTWSPPPMIVQQWSIVACGLFTLCSTSIQCCDNSGELPTAAAATSGDEFLVRPYLQLGDVPPSVVTNDLRVLWHAGDIESDWAVEYRPSPEGSWQSAEAPVARRVAVPGIAPHRVYRSVLRGL